jgi:hypothetical protein
MMNNAMVIDKN